MQNKCWECKTKDGVIKVMATRRLGSPGWGYGWGAMKPWYEYFCSKECQRRFQEAEFAFWASIDRNASDSECFQHFGWEGEYRVGKCKINGAEVKVQPLMFGENSGQPRECYKHFVLRKKYQDVLNKYD